MSNEFIIFGQSTNNTSVPHSLMGMPGWWQVPAAGIFVRPCANATNNWEVSPNADFSKPVYIATMDYDGTMCFQQTLASQMANNT